MGGRRQAAISTVDVTGVPSADSGRHSTIPDAVAAPWDLQRGIGQARHCSHYCSANTDHPDWPPTGEGARDLHVSPGPSGMHARTPTRGSGAVPRHYYRQDNRRNLRRTKDEIQDDSDARRLPTVYFLQYPTTVPRNLGENDDFYALTHVHRPSL